MANDSITEQPQSAEPDAGLRQFGCLFGTWKIFGGVTGHRVWGLGPEEVLRNG